MTAACGCALVIGGTGFIGSHLVEKLAASGRHVRVVARRARWPWGEPPPAVEIVALDIADPDASTRLRALIEDAAFLVNLAGMLARPGLSADLYRKLHVDGAARVAAAARFVAEGRVAGPRTPAPAREPEPHGPVGARIAARELIGTDAGVPMATAVRPGSVDTADSADLLRTPPARLRLVHVSTTGVLGPTGATPLSESSRSRPSTLYESTKLEGEQVSMSQRADGLEVVVLRPGLVYGPRDLHLLGLYRSIGSGAFRLISGGRARWQPIYVDDVVEGILAAIRSPSSDGERFHLAGKETLSVADLSRRIAARLGVRLKGPNLPYGIAYGAGALLEAACRPFGGNPPLSRSRVRTLTEDRLYSTLHAERHLGFAPKVGIDEGLDQTIAWYRDHGLLV